MVRLARYRPGHGHTFALTSPRRPRAITLHVHSRLPIKGAPRVLPGACGGTVIRGAFFRLCTGDPADLFRPRA